MGNFVCGQYVILNVDDSTTDSNANKNEGKDVPVSSGDVGNTLPSDNGGGGDTQPTALDISRQIQRQMLRIQGEFMTEEGRKVDYDSIKKSDVFSEYLKTAELLRRCSLASLDDDENERKAFFINVYNALNIHGVISAGGLPDSLTGKLGYWKRTGYLIDNMRFTLDDIEHGILRGNSRASSQIFGSAYFPESDPRLRFRLVKDQRIHFALNCGARSCPAIRVYDGRNLERGLNSATNSFCQSEVKVVEKDAGIHVELSHLFKWFRGDFVPKSGKGDPVLRWIVENVLEVESCDLIRRELDEGKAVEITYSPYDWTCNAH